MMNFSEIPAFAKEFRKFHKKYRSLSEDFEEFKRIISHIPTGTSKHFHVIARKQNIQIIKARFFCRYLKGSSLRIIYAYSESQKHIEFIELYFKGNKPNEDYGRIEEYIKQL